MKALDHQEGGNHYKNFVIQPAEFIVKNRLDYATGNVVKYVCRHRFKGGKQDLLKAIHYLQMLLELEYPDDRPSNSATRLAEELQQAKDPMQQLKDIPFKPALQCVPGVYVLNRRAQGGVTLENAVRYINNNAAIFSFETGGLCRTGNLNAAAFEGTELTYTGYKTVAEYLASNSTQSDSSVDIPSPPTA